MNVDEIKEITLFCEQGDSAKISTWSNVPYFLAKTLEERGIKLNRVNLNPGSNRFHKAFYKLWNVFAKGVFRNKYYTYRRSGIYYFLIERRIRKALRQFPNADLCLEMSQGEVAVAAFSAPVATTIPNDVWVYSATASDDQTVTLKHVEGKVLPANTPVILAARTAGNYEFLPSVSEDEAVKIENNLLKCTTGGLILAPAQCMVLNFGNGEAYMAPAQMGTALKGYSAYLPQNGQSVKKTLVFDELPPAATGILTPEGVLTEGNNKIYDLSGRQVKNPTKGVYIRNGQKFIVKP